MNSYGEFYKILALWTSMLSLFSSRSQNQTFSLVCRQPLPYRSAASPRQQVPDDCLWRRQRSSDSGDVTCGAAAPFPSAEVCVPRSVAFAEIVGAESVGVETWRSGGGSCSVTQPSIHYPSIPPSSKVFAPQGIIPPDSVTVEPPQRGCGWNTFPLTIFHLLPVCPTIATVTEAYLCLSALRSDTSSQWLWCFFSNEVTVAAAAAKWFVA